MNTKITILLFLFFIVNGFAKLSAQSSKFETNLELAANALADGELEKFKEYFSKGFDVNKEVKLGKEIMPLLHIATLLNNFQAVQFLVENGADVNLLDKYTCTPWLYAKRDGFTEISDYLKSKGSNEAKLLSDLESSYKSCTDPVKCAHALSKWEKFIMLYIEFAGVEERITFSEIQASNEKYSTRVTISPNSNLSNGYSFLFEGTTDQLTLGDMRIGDWAIIRFKGKVMFPCDLSSGGLMDGMTLSYTEGGEALGITNSTICFCDPTSKAWLFEGDEGSPLTFAMFKNLGFVYLHGSGKVTKANGEIIEIQ